MKMSDRRWKMEPKLHYLGRLSLLNKGIRKDSETSKNGKREEYCGMEVVLFNNVKLNRLRAWSLRPKMVN